MIWVILCSGASLATLKRGNWAEQCWLDRAKRHSGGRNEIYNYFNKMSYFWIYIIIRYHHVQTSLKQLKCLRFSDIFQLGFCFITNKCLIRSLLGNCYTPLNCSTKKYLIGNLQCWLQMYQCPLIFPEQPYNTCLISIVHCVSDTMLNNMLQITCMSPSYTSENTLKPQGHIMVDFKTLRTHCRRFKTLRTQYRRL